MMLFLIALNFILGFFTYRLFFNIFRIHYFFTFKKYYTSKDYDVTLFCTIFGYVSSVVIIFILINERYKIHSFKNIFFYNEKTLKLK